jgi:hypothetical protein
MATPLAMAKPERHRIAIWCHSWYLVNLLLLPGFGFLALCYLVYKYHRLSRYLRRHFQRSVLLSLLAGILLLTPLLIIYFSESFASYFMVYLFYFIVVHATFVMLGMINLTRAMAHKLPLF